jgi:hypothetical protein
MPSKKEARRKKMPKLVVFVEKDENGKLWDYSFTREQWGETIKSIPDSQLTIHNSCSDKIVCNPAKTTTTPATDTR